MSAAAVPPSRRPLPRALAACVASAVLALGAHAQGRIDILNRDGAVVQRTGVTITKETLDQVKFMEGARERDVATAEVVAIEYGPGSRAFQRARDALAAGDIEDAIALFETARHESDPPWVAAVATLRKADAQMQAGELEPARQTLDAFVRDHADHRRLPEALLMQARLAGAMRDPAAVETATASILQLVDAGRVTLDWKVRALLERGEADLVAGAFDAARKAFSDAQAEADRGARSLGAREDLAPVVAALRLQASVGLGSVMLANGDIPGARAHFERLAREAGDDLAARVAAENGLAEADFSEGGKLKEAQLGFARVALRAAGNPDEHARALYYLGRCAAQLGEEGLEPNGAITAQAYYDDVQKWYPNTRWARLAREAQP